MGNTLDKPKTDKDTSVGSDSQDGLSWGVSSMQGWRLSMEDAHICAPSKYEEKLTLDDSSSDAADGATSMDTNGIRLQVQQANQNDNDKAKATKNPSSSKDKSIDEEPQQINKDHKATNPEEQDSLQLPPHHYFFCVLDGHGGDFAAHYGRDNLLPILLEQDSFQEYEKLIWKATTTLSSSLEESSTKFGGKKRKQAGHPKNKNQANRNHPRQLKKDRNMLERQSLLLQRALEDAFVELDLLLLHEMVQQKMVLVPPLAVDTADMDDTIIMDDDWGTYDRMEEDTTTTSTTTSNSQNANGDTIPGTTAVAVLVTPDWILCANLGDSRASLLLSSYPKSKVQSSSPQQHASNKKKNKQKEHNKNKKKDGAADSSRVDDGNSSKSEADYWTIVALSEDHKPDLPEEQARIEAANGNVTMGGRVDGELAVSRAFGDFGFKEAYPRDLYSGERIQNRRSSRRRRRIQSKLGESKGLNDSLDADNQEEGMDWERQRAMAQQLKVSPFPEVFAYPRHRGKDDRTDDSNHGQEKVLLLGCDGVWDVMTNENCHSLVQELLLEGETNMGLIAEEILDTCLKKGSRDNMSIIVIHFADTSVSSSGTDKSHTISGGGGGGGVLKRRKQRNSADRGS